MFRSTDRGESFRPIVAGEGSTQATRGMVMRLLEVSSGVLGVLSDGTVMWLSEDEESISIIAEKLPPAYDLVVLPGG